MLLDISGNTFSTLGPSVPTRLIGPRELFGDSLLVHVDTSDYRNLFTTATGSTNVSLTGQSQVKRIDDISGKGSKFYYFTGATSLESTIINGSTIQETFTSTTINQYSGSSFDTNKGVFGIDSGIPLVNQSTNIVMTSPFSVRNDIAPQSAATVCSYFTYLNNMTSTFNLGLSRQYQFNNNFGFLFTTTGTFLQFHVKASSRFQLTPTPFIGKTIMLLGTITGNSYSIYINNNLITSGTMTGSIYPLTAQTAEASGGFLLDTLQNPLTINTTCSKTHEAFISSSYTTPEQAKLLYNYFITKFKNKVGNYI